MNSSCIFPLTLALALLWTSQTANSFKSMLLNDFIASNQTDLFSSTSAKEKTHPYRTSSNDRSAFDKDDSFSEMKRQIRDEVKKVRKRSKKTQNKQKKKSKKEPRLLEINSLSNKDALCATWEPQMTVRSNATDSSVFVDYCPATEEYHPKTVTCLVQEDQEELCTLLLPPTCSFTFKNITHHKVVATVRAECDCFEKRVHKGRCTNPVFTKEVEITLVKEVLRRTEADEQTLALAVPLGLGALFFVVATIVVLIKLKRRKSKCCCPLHKGGISTNSTAHVLSVNRKLRTSVELSSLDTSVYPRSSDPEISLGGEEDREISGSLAGVKGTPEETGLSSSNSSIEVKGSTMSVLTCVTIEYGDSAESDGSRRPIQPTANPYLQSGPRLLQNRDLQGQVHVDMPDIQPNINAGSLCEYGNNTVADYLRQCDTPGIHCPDSFWPQHPVQFRNLPKFEIPYRLLDEYKPDDGASNNRRNSFQSRKSDTLNGHRFNHRTGLQYTQSRDSHFDRRYRCDPGVVGLQCGQTRYGPPWPGCGDIMEWESQPEARKCEQRREESGNCRTQKVEDKLGALNYHRSHDDDDDDDDIDKIKYQQPDDGDNEEEEEDEIDKLKNEQTDIEERDRYKCELSDDDEIDKLKSERYDDNDEKRQFDV